MYFFVVHTFVSGCFRTRTLCVVAFPICNTTGPGASCFLGLNYIILPLRHVDVKCVAFFSVIPFLFSSRHAFFYLGADSFFEQACIILLRGNCFESIQNASSFQTKECFGSIAGYVRLLVWDVIASSASVNSKCFLNAFGI